MEVNGGQLALVDDDLAVGCACIVGVLDELEC